jgi:hypothetical protein
MLGFEDKERKEKELNIKDGFRAKSSKINAKKSSKG